MNKYWSILFLVLAFGAAPHGASAYEKEVHFNLTYTLCRLAGFSNMDAIWIADADQSMDDNDVTTCFDRNTAHTLATISSAHNGKLWHDFSDANKSSGDTILSTIHYSDQGRLARQYINTRLNILWANVEKASKKYRADHEENSRIAANIAMGQYLHAEQDYFSHRQFTNDYLNPNKYLPYGPRVGHIHDGDDSYADYVALRPALAYLMAQDSYRRISEYNNDLSGNDENYGIAVLATYMKRYLNSLVNALASTYTKPNPMPSNYDIEPEATTEYHAVINGPPYKSYLVAPPTSQKKINQALQDALFAIPIPNGWRGSLPEYNEDDRLPYDYPSTSLELVRERVQKLSKETLP